ncbi:hypothetical protein SAMN02983003_3416 [Devosia enhydra]|uniref:Porin n=1 Tax=Devosia enhydra TaxID=665118 RepID=A0A1K2I1H5_9HYPH|nr:Lpg1974 family pore-forming outer membrane protein [Devosia enhydra]SFZ86238.1 hypothetical protein SAMN02983003_3416 [Devosia enhydra]
MRLKTVLMGSVSALATGAVATVPAQAQDQGYTFSVQGGALLSKADQAFLDKEGDKGGPVSGIGVVESEIPDNFGYTAGVTVGKRLNSEWDVMFGASVNRLIDSTYESFGSGSSFSGSSSYTPGVSGSYSGFDGGFEITGVSNFSFETMEFDVGFRPVLDADLNVRLFAGIQALHFDRNVDFAGILGASGENGSFNTSGNGTYSGGEYIIGGNVGLRSEFFGAGPRIGVSGSKAFGNGFGLSGSLAGSAVFGRQTNTTTFNAAGEGSSYSGTISGGVQEPSVSSGSSFPGVLPITSQVSTVDKIVLGVEASAGVDYYLDQSSTLTFGYQAKSLYNVGATDDFDASDSNKLVHGPFLKFQSSF